MHFHTLSPHPAQLRGHDEWGSGAFGAPRGDHSHRGIDMRVAPGDAIYAPFDGLIVREAIPYDDDDRFSGLLLRGVDAWQGFEIKIFYMHCTHSLGQVPGGELVGIAQNIALRYPGITNHIHVELRKDGNLQDPTPFLPPEETP